jgi:serine/threonine protein kinase
MSGGAEVETEDQILKIGQSFGKYRVVRLLGRGGMGSVYEALHVDLKKRVAIKVLSHALATTTEGRARFVREGEAAARIQHPHVVGVDDVGTLDGICYLVMEYLDGEDLSKRLGREHHLSPTATADVMVPVIAAVSAAHEENVIHRDLKPENIFLERLRRGGIQPKVLDFGVSKLLNDTGGANLTGTGGLFGTPYYMAPEQLLGAKFADAGSDQYAIGAILYECVTGRRTHEGDSIYAVLRSIGDGVFLPPRRLQSDIPEKFERMILRALEKDPAARFSNMGALGGALLEFASEEVRLVWRGQFGGQSVPAPASKRSPSYGNAGGTQILPPATTTLRSSIGQLANDIVPVLRPRRRLSTFVVIGGAAAAVAGLAFIANRPSTPAHAPPSPPAAIPSPSTFEASIRALPLDAMAAIQLDGVLLGQSEVKATLQRDGVSHTISVTAKGYLPRRVQFQNEGPPSSITLQKEPEALAPPPSAAPQAEPVNSSRRRTKHAPSARSSGTGGKASEGERSSRSAHANPNQNAAPIVE